MKQQRNEETSVNSVNSVSSVVRFPEKMEPGATTKSSAPGSRTPSDPTSFHPCPSAKSVVQKIPFFLTTDDTDGHGWESAPAEQRALRFIPVGNQTSPLRPLFVSFVFFVVGIGSVLFPLGVRCVSVRKPPLHHSPSGWGIDPAETQRRGASSRR